MESASASIDNDRALATSWPVLFPHQALLGETGKEVAQCLARLGAEALFQHLRRLDPIQAKGPEIIAQFTTGGQRPGMAPGIKTQGPDTPRGGVTFDIVID